MPETVKGIILKETAYGDFDKILTVLTAEHGKISVYAKGAKKLKSPIFPITQLFSYSEMILHRTGNTYYVRNGTLLESFYHLRDTLEGASLAGYLADVMADITVENEPSDGLLRLILNSFFMIAGGKKPLALIKATFELRSASIVGFRPDLVACVSCGRSDAETFYFDIGDGVVRCEDCFHAHEGDYLHDLQKQNPNEGIYTATQDIAILSPSVFAAMRYAVYAKPERLFSFDVKEDALHDFSTVAEKYLLRHMERNYPTLDFYHTVSK